MTHILDPYAKFAVGDIVRYKGDDYIIIGFYFNYDRRDFQYDLIPHKQDEIIYAKQEDLELI